MTAPYTIIYEDQDLIVCDKAAGVPVQSARLGVKDLMGLIKTYLRETGAEADASVKSTQKVQRGNRQGGGTQRIESGEPYLGMIHRLDQPVRGIVVFAKNQKAAAHLSAQVQDGRMEKIYLARVYLPEGTRKADAPKDGELTDLLVKDARANISKVVKGKVPGAKTAKLSYTLLPDSDFAKEAAAAQDRSTAVYRIHLHTGRHHQIRVQMSNASMPLVGDHKYATGIDENKYPCLCAAKLSFDHPRTGKRMHFFSTKAKQHKEVIPWLKH